MQFQTGEFLELLDGSVLEVVYADESKAVCLRASLHDGIWFYEGGSAVISNKQADYDKGKAAWKKISNVDIVKNRHWKPLAAQYLYPML